MNRMNHKGFSLLEVMMVMAIFLIVTGAVFGLMNATQIQYRGESQFMASFDGARVGMDLMLRDIHNAGYPPPYTFAGNLPGLPTGPTPAPLTGVTWDNPYLAPAAVQQRFAMGVIGASSSGGGSMQPRDCTVNGAAPGFVPCTVPNPWQLLIETDLDPESLVPQVEWVYYDLRLDPGGQTSTLYRTVNPKIPGGNPILPISVLPFVENMIQLPGQGIGLTNPALFVYQCDPEQVLIPGTNICLADHIKTVYVTLRVRSNAPEPRSNPARYRTITMQGAASRYYPSLTTRR